MFNVKSALLTGLLLLPVSFHTKGEVIPNEEGWWSTGVVVGTVVGRGWENGIFKSSGKFGFAAGGGDPKYPPVNYSIYVEEEYKDTLWNQVNLTKAPVVVEYIYPFFRNVFRYPSSNYFLTKITEVKSNFKDLDIHNEYPDGRVIAPAYRQIWETVGMPIHVSRWGKVIDHRCTVYLHQGGNETISVTEWEWSDELVYDYYTSEFAFRSVQRPVTYYKTVPRVVLLDTFNEEICQYAEGAATTRTRLYIQYSGSQAVPQDVDDTVNNPVIHAIHVFDE